MSSSLRKNGSDLGQGDQFGNIIERIREAKSVEDLFNGMQESILPFLNGERITIFMLDQDGKNLKSVKKTGAIPSQIKVTVGQDSVAGFVVSTGSAVSIANAYNNVELMTISDDLKFDSSWDRRSGYQTRQVLATPITYNGNAIGVLQVINKSGGGRFTSSDRQVINEIGTAVGVTLNQLKKK